MSDGTTRTPARLGRLSRIPWHPTLLGLAFVLSPTVGSGASIAAVNRPLLIAVAVGVSGVLIAWLPTRDLDLAGILGLFLVFGVLYSRNILLPLVLIIAASSLVVERRARAHKPGRIPWPKVTDALNTIAVLLVLLQVVSLTADEVTAQQPTFDRAWNATVVPPEKPDIYLVLLDAHARPDVLRDSFGYDPTLFVNSLASLGFELAPASQSNYMVTALSLASMFSGSHVSELGVKMDTEPSLPLILRAIAQNPTFPLLHRAGYETVAISSGYEGVSLRTADRFVDDGMPNEVEDVLWSTTAVGPLLDAIAPHHRSDAIRTRTKDTFAQLPALAREPHRSPRFVFAHVALPHSPYVFGPHCEAREAVEERTLLVRVTADQNSCIDFLSLESMRALVAADPTAIVLLFSDHGPGTRLNWSHPSNDGLRERFANLVLARTPGHSGLLPPDVTLVNILPLVFNAYLGTELPLRTNDQYVGRFNGGRLVPRSELP